MSAETVRPISPKEIAGNRMKTIPGQVLEAFNELIVQNYKDGEIVIKQKEAEDLMVAKGLNRDEIYNKGWMDVEGIYRKAGWKVEFDQPAFNETFDAYFTFSHRRQRA